MTKPSLVVTREQGLFRCTEEGAVGMCIEGRGLTVLEAIGDWCLYSAVVSARCDPPKLLDKFSAKKVKGYHKIPRRC